MSPTLPRHEGTAAFRGHSGTAITTPFCSRGFSPFSAVSKTLCVVSAYMPPRAATHHSRSENRLERWKRGGSAAMRRVACGNANAWEGDRRSRREVLRLV